MRFLENAPTVEELNEGAPNGVEIEHLAPTIGTVVHGLDLSLPLTESSLAFLKALFLKRGVIFFRGQRISPRQQVALCRNWGALELAPFLPHLDGYPEVLHINRGSEARAAENIWHSDMTWRRNPALGSMLYAVRVPDLGGDTLWADMCAAYEGLPDHLKRACDGLLAAHSIANATLSSYVDHERISQIAQTNPPSLHPVIRTHPVTGRKAIYVNRAYTLRIEGLSRQDSEDLLNILCAQVTYPEYQCRFKWLPGSMSFWDNRCTQHYACSDYYPQSREMHRVAIAGDEPF